MGKTEGEESIITGPGQRMNGWGGTIEWTDSLRRPKNYIHRYARQLVGLTHPNKNGKDRLVLARTLNVGTPLVLVPERNNALDRNAILIYRADDPKEDLGYLDATGAKQICRMIECGAKFDADVYWIDNRRDFPKIYIWVYQLTAVAEKRRPARQNAPAYTNYVKHREAPAPPMPHPAVPSFGQSSDDSGFDAGGPIRSLIRLLKSFLP